MPTRTRSPNGSKYLGVCKVGSRVRRIDLFTCPTDQIAAATLTYTGSDVHNRSMRLWASTVGFVLSEKALCPCVRSTRSKYAGKDGKWTDNKEWVGDAVPVGPSPSDEASIFALLGLRYLPPAERTGQVQHLHMSWWSTFFVSQIFAKVSRRTPSKLSIHP